MNRLEIYQLTTDRLTNWRSRLVEEHATPVLLLGIGHDHNKGKGVLCTLENLPDDHVKALLMMTLDLVDKGPDSSGH